MLPKRAQSAVYVTHHSDNGGVTRYVIYINYPLRGVPQCGFSSEDLCINKASFWITGCKFVYI